MNGLLVFLGFLLTAAYFFFGFCVLGESLPKLNTMELNEVGDFLAGIFGPVALLWLVIGIILQSFELRSSRQALLLQANELKESVKQQRDLVQVTREQLSQESKSRLAAQKKAAYLNRPLFKLKHTFGVFIRDEMDSKTAIAFSFVNTGNVAFQVSVKPPHYAQLENESLPYSVDKTVNFKITLLFEAQSPEVGEFRMKYYDSLGNFWCDTYALKCHYRTNNLLVELELLNSKVETFGVE
ncbi:MAG: hypothetical protein JKY26_17625 [Pseudomonas sp.]|nr:hypothetical protein [Pseudomonas sp.]